MPTPCRRYPVERYEITMYRSSEIVVTFDAAPNAALPSGPVHRLLLPKSSPSDMLGGRARSGLLRPAPGVKWGTARLRFESGGELLFPDIDHDTASALLSARQLTFSWCLLSDMSMGGAEVPRALRFRAE